MASELYQDLLCSFVKLLELRNPFNIHHCQLVAQYCLAVSKHMGMSLESQQKLERAAQVHTLGVLLQMEEKQADRSLPISGLGELSGREVSIHVREEQIFRRVLAGSPAFDGCLEILLQRHEWYDGSGSIHGLAGAQICPEARLMAVVDAYVDLVTPKAHRPPESHIEALNRLRELAGLQFDPTCVRALEKTLEAEESQEISRREARFQVAHCRHYLGLGHFYTQIHESDWALRSYRAAQRMAARIGDSGLELASISGQCMVYCDRQQLDRARETLQELRTRGSSARDQLGYQLLWGLLEWLGGNRLGQEILDPLIERHARQQNLPGLTAALAFQTCMTLFHLGPRDEQHLAYLRSFLKLLASHDVFDVAERYRPYTIPALLNAVIQEIESQLARNLLTRMGEPCHGPLQQRLEGIHPRRWTQELMATPVLSEARPSPSETGWDLYIQTLGTFQVGHQNRQLGVEAWKSLKNMKVFQRLAQVWPREVQGELLAEELWPESGPEKARDSLRNSLAQIRKTLRNLMNNENLEVIRRDRKSGQVALELRCRFDFEDFEATFARAQDAFQAGDLGSALELAQEALGQYQGEFLEGFEEEWVLATRSRLAGLHYHAKTLMARTLLQKNDPLQAEQAARQLLALDDLREEAHSLLLEALVAQGRSVEAVAQFEHARQLFEEEIGVFPEQLRSTLENLGLLL